MTWIDIMKDRVKSEALGIDVSCSSFFDFLFFSFFGFCLCVLFRGSSYGHCGLEAEHSTRLWFERDVGIWSAA